MSLDDALRFDQAAYAVAQQRAQNAPLDLTEDDFDQLAVISTRAEADAREALRQAQLALVAARAEPAHVLQTKSAEPTAPAETPDAFLRRLSIPDVTTDGVLYDTKRFELAYARYLDDPKTMTVDDLQQFAVVSRGLGTLARARQVGYVERDIADADGARAVSHKEFLSYWGHVLIPLLATYRYKGDQAHGRLDALERRVLELEGKAAARSEVLT
jgi:hypothetical protein